ncbi:hypothetical protein [Caballeronia sp. TF1N1]|uniref:hypothetical protein n=1 Tax=Caballeronia sp. TF1N1 TaxID=2878153 RepID=UPI001FCFB7C3|nr:hypothetical protein [Caballeronia sp. TF1N1]
MSSEPTPGNRWNQRQVSFWLTPKRKEKLQALVAASPGIATPTDAIDRAIELASTPIFVPASEIDAAREMRESRTETLSAMDLMERRLHSAVAACRESSEQSARKILADVERAGVIAEEMRGMMADAAANGFGDATDDQERESSPISLKDWLDAASAMPDGIRRKSIQARAVWQAKTRASGPFVSMDFSCQLVAASNAEKRQMPAPALVRVELIEWDDPISRLDSFDTHLFLCNLLPGGSWQVAARSLDKEGKTKTVVGSFLA